MENIKQSKDIIRSLVNIEERLDNVYSLDQKKESINSTLDKCINILESHLGPNSKYAMLIDAFEDIGEIKPHEFTRDGIRILRSLDFYAPIENYIKNFIAYIGTNVDHIAKDGTTTSMLFAAKMIKQMLNSNMKCTNTRRFINSNRNVVDAIIHELNNMAVKYTADSDKLDKVAYLQALSSSGGDVKLAKSVRDLFKQTPPELYDLMRFENARFETDTEFELVRSPYDYRVEAQVVLAQHLNAAMGSEIKADKVRVIVFTQPVYDAEIKSGNLSKYLYEDTSETTTIVIAPQLAETFKRAVTEFNNTRTAKIILFEHYSQLVNGSNPYPWELMVLSGKANVTPYSDPSVNPIDNYMSDKYTFMADSIHYHNGCIDFYGITDNDAKNKPDGYFEVIRKQLQERVDSFENSYEKNTELKGIYATMLNDLLSNSRPVIVLGGTVTEHIANHSVIEDAIGASISSIQKGFLPSGYLTFVDAVKRAITAVEITYGQDSLEAKLIKYYMNACDVETYVEKLGGDMDIASKLIYGSDNLSSRPLNGEELSYYNIDTVHKEPTPYTWYLNEVIDHEDDFTSKDLNNYPTMHPVRIYEELLKRTAELIIRIGVTNEFVIHGGLVKDNAS